MRQRPMSLLIFGILNIGYALFKLAGTALTVVMSHVGSQGNPVAEAMKKDPTLATWTKFSLPLTVVLGLALLAFGIGLLFSKDWARLGSIVWSVLEIVIVIFGTLLVWPVMQRAMAQMPNMPHGMVEGFATIGLVIGLVFGLAYPALVLFYMTRDNVIEACQPELPGQEPPQAA